MLTNTTLFLRFLRYLHALLGLVFTIFLIYILVSAFFFTAFSVSGKSMDPTLRDGQFLGIDLIGYEFTSPKKGDIVIVAYQGVPSLRFVKRITGMPGDTVIYKDRPLKLGPNQYFILGDNAAHSTDSRVFGPIERSQILGRAIWY